MKFSAIAVPGLGRHIFSPLVGAKTGIVTIFDPTHPRLAMGNAVEPMESLDHDTILCSVSLELDKSPTW